jgi:hypothetical protein
VFSENVPSKMDVCVFNTEYRVLQKMKRIGTVCRKKQCHSMMGELLTSANGATAYDFSLERLLSHIQEYRDMPESSGFVPMTIIAWKIFSGCMFCSVERIFLRWDSGISFEENLLFNAYMEQSVQVASKLLQEHYYPLGVIGKGDYTRTLRKVFAGPFGYTVI